MHSCVEGRAGVEETVEDAPKNIARTAVKRHYVTSGPEYGGKILMVWEAFPVVDASLGDLCLPRLETLIMERLVGRQVQACRLHCKRCNGRGQSEVTDPCQGVQSNLRQYVSWRSRYATQQPSSWLKHISDRQSRYLLHRHDRNR